MKPYFLEARQFITQLTVVFSGSKYRAIGSDQLGKNRIASSLFWSHQKLVRAVKTTFEIDCCHDTLRKVLKQLGFSWKKARKLLNKANLEKRAAFLETLEGLLDDALHPRCLLVYIDEAHIHLDTDEGNGWSIKEERFWVSSGSPGLKKVSFYGLYLYDLAQVRIFPYDVANQGIAGRASVESGIGCEILP